MQICSKSHDDLSVNLGPLLFVKFGASNFQKLVKPLVCPIGFVPRCAFKCHICYNGKSYCNGVIGYNHVFTHAVEVKKRQKYIFYRVYKIELSTFFPLESGFFSNTHIKPRRSVCTLEKLGLYLTFSFPCGMILFYEIQHCLCHIGCSDLAPVSFRRHYCRYA